MHWDFSALLGKIDRFEPEKVPDNTASIGDPHRPVCCARDAAASLSEFSGSSNDRFVITCYI